MAMTLVQSSDPGAPSFTGVNGQACTVLDYILNTVGGWAIEFTATNNRVYRPTTGNRFRLFVCHDSAVTGDARLCLIRGCESASAASTASLTDPFPTVTQVANASSTFLTSTLANSTARAWFALVSPTFVAVFIDCGGTTQQNWDLFVFGDTEGEDAADVWNTVCWVGGITTATGSTGRAMAGVVGSAPITSGRVFWVRSVDGSIKSSHGCISGPSGSSSAVALCSMSSAPVMQGGYGNRIVREKMGVTCIGSSTSTVGSLALVKRGFLPNLHLPIHSGIGAVTTLDTFEDVSSGADFRVAIANVNAAVIVETSDTWSAPSG